MLKLGWMGLLVLLLLVLQVEVTYAGWEGLGGKTSKVLALQPDVKHGEMIYNKNCIACHELEGWGSMYGSFPQLAGQHQSVLVKQFLNMQSGKRNNPVMKDVLAKEEFKSSQNIADVTAYVSSLPMTEDNGKGAGENVVLGEKLYGEICVSCHGANAMGNAEVGIPLLLSQHYSYILKQFKAIRSGDRANANPAMIAAVKGLRDDEIEAVLDYVSRIKPPVERRSGKQNFASFMDELRNH